jgi:hypothetical protein
VYIFICMTNCSTIEQVGRAKPAFYQTSWLPLFQLQKFNFAILLKLLEKICRLRMYVLYILYIYIF